MNDSKFQIRLILDKELADKLSIIASSHYLSRLALIRSYLKKAIDEDLVSLANQLGIKRDQQTTCDAIKSIIKKKEQKREYDEW